MAGRRYRHRVLLEIYGCDRSRTRFPWAINGEIYMQSRGNEYCGKSTRGLKYSYRIERCCCFVLMADDECSVICGDASFFVVRRRVIWMIMKRTN